jgi:hypothetical protein
MPGKYMLRTACACSLAMQERQKGASSACLGRAFALLVSLAAGIRVRHCAKPQGACATVHCYGLGEGSSCCCLHACYIYAIGTVLGCSACAAGSAQGVCCCRYACRAYATSCTLGGGGSACAAGRAHGVLLLLCCVQCCVCALGSGHDLPCAAQVPRSVCCCCLHWMSSCIFAQKLSVSSSCSTICGADSQQGGVWCCCCAACA